MTQAILITIAITAIAAAVWHHVRRKRMQHQCYLMAEALRNHDYTFRLSTHGWYGSDRKAIECINAMMQHLAYNRQDTEIDSWVKLTHILTHEIMNSAAPIASLSDTLMDRADVKQSPIYDAMKAINDTSHNLMRFVNSYRHYTLVPKPEMAPTHVAQLTEQIRQINMVPPHIRLDIDTTPADLTLTCDPTQTTQVLINIVKNAVENLQSTPTDNPHIAITAHRNYRGNVEISIRNNGQTIPPEVRQNIFVPFYTTKPQGTGIGLPLCLQILHQQHAHLTLDPPHTNGWATTFKIEFDSNQNN